MDVARLIVTTTSGSAPVANFSGTPTIGTPTLAVTFTDSSTNSPTAWSWNFGDSSTSTVQNPSHSYTAVGSYTVALKATNANGNNTMTKNNYISVGNAPVANFSGTPTSGAAPLAVTFTDSSTNTPTSWSWNFGDSNTSTVQNPSHTYSAGGTYTVALTATNAYGNNTNTKSNYITVGQRPGGELLRHADDRRADPGGDLHRLLHQHADRVVLELRGLQHLHGAEPESLLYRGWHLHGRAEGDQCLRQQHQHQEQLHHRRQ